ncbi:hypothetical protein ACFYT4_02020 [Streptomyces sp. NPDC004609]|uniref:hypothetical protein n=1 Tax=Streptomyces sp. NPDC004609 TaxID=3364704 RepID=UPI0036C89763
MTAAVVVLAGYGDTGAAAVARAVAARLGGDRVLPVSPGELARARWSHRVGPDGRAATRIVLPGGRVLDDAGTGAVLHRLPYLAPAGLSRTSSAKDRDYASAELHALVAAWLLGLGPRVLGTVSSYGTAQGPLSATAALVHAERCGLPVARRGGATRAGLIGAVRPGERLEHRLAWPGGSAAPVPVELWPNTPPDPGGRVLVCGEAVVGPLAARHAERCRRLGGLLRTSLFELCFAAGAVVRIDPLPPLGTDVQRSAVARALTALAGTAPGRDL